MRLIVGTPVPAWPLVKIRLSLIPAATSVLLIALARLNPASSVSPRPVIRNLTLGAADNTLLISLMLSVLEALKSMVPFQLPEVIAFAMLSATPPGVSLRLGKSRLRGL